MTVKYDIALKQNSSVIPAEVSDIKFSTARSYLEQIFLKTGTNQQSQLVALLKSAGPVR